MNIWDRSSVKNGLARTCITKNNYREVPQIYSFCIEHRLIPSFTFVSALGNGIDNWDNLDTSMAQKMWCIDSINRLNNKYHLDISPPESPATCNFTEKSGIGGLLIRADGNIAPCQYFYNKTIGNIYTDEIDDILKHPLITQLYETAQKRREILENSSKCKNCKVKARAWSPEGPTCDYGMYVEENACPEVKISDRILIFLGETSAGKTTLSTYLDAKSYATCFGDDLVIIDNEKMLVYPLSAYTHLRQGSIDIINCDIADKVSFNNMMQRYEYPLKKKLNIKPIFRLMLLSY